VVANRLGIDPRGKRVAAAQMLDMANDYSENPEGVDRRQDYLVGRKLSGVAIIQQSEEFE
jgi:hypothetical protein